MGIQFIGRKEQDEYENSKKNSKKLKALEDEIKKEIQEDVKDIFNNDKRMTKKHVEDLQKLSDIIEEYRLKFEDLDTNDRSKAKKRIDKKRSIFEKFFDCFR